MSKALSLVMSTENDAKMERNENECCICLYQFTTSNPETVMTCKHEYHADCILNWCETSSHCPICQRNIPPKDIIACYESKKRAFRRSAGKSSKMLKKLGKFSGNVAESSKELGISGSKAATGLLKWEEFAATPTDLLHAKADAYRLKALKYSAASRIRYVKEKAALEREITKFKLQLRVAALAEANANKVATTYIIQKDALISDLKKQLNQLRLH